MMKRAIGSFGIVAASGIALVMCAATVIAAPLKSSQAEGLVSKIVSAGDGIAQKSGAGEDFGWHVGYSLGDFVKGYKASHDTSWLTEAVKAYDYVVGKMSTGPDGYKGWVGAYEYDHKVWADVHVSDALMINYLLEFSELVLKDEALKKTYGEAANRYVALARHDLVEKWDKRGTWHEDGPYGAYTQWDTFCAPNDLSKWIKQPNTEVKLSLPFNKQNHMGQCLMKLYRITGEKMYHDRAQRIFAFMKSRMQLAGDFYTWNYWEPFGPWDVDLDKKDTALWMNTHTYRNYQAGEIYQIVEAYNTGVAFDQTDMQRILNTNLEVMWNKDKSAPQFINSNAKLPEPELTPEQKQAREAQIAKNPYAKDGRAGCLWAGLDQFDKTIRELEPATFESYDAVGKAYFEEVTQKAPAGFARLYSQCPATPFEFPFHVIQSITVGAVMPCTITRGKPSIVLCKARISVDLEVAVYSADGKEKKLVLLQEKVVGGIDGHDGIHILQWDGSDPAGKVHLPKGDYLVRWTVPDGYREFPVTIAE